VHDTLLTNNDLQMRWYKGFAGHAVERVGCARSLPSARTSRLYLDLLAGCVAGRAAGCAGGCLLAAGFLMTSSSSCCNGRTCIVECCVDNMIQSGE